jgi:hypothetical protein
MIRLLAAALAIIALGTACGCARTLPPPSTSWRTSERAAEPGRVAVLAFWSGDGVGRSSAAVGEAMAASLRELGLHEVLLVGIDRRRALLPDDVLLANRLSVEQLLRLRDELRCDSVLLGRIEQFTGYDPVAMGLSVHLVSCADGEKLWEATSHLDGSRQDVQDDLRKWYDRSAGRGAPGIAGWRGVLASPTAFARYVTDRLVSTLPPPSR